MALTNIRLLNTGSCISSNIVYVQNPCRVLLQTLKTQMRCHGFKVKDNPHRHNLFLMLYVPCQQFLSHAGMISCLPGSNQYQAADKVSCSSTHLHSESVGGESPTSSPYIPSLTLSHLSH